jgi:F-type H+-transporting ATPase subunit epsilon
MLVDIISPDKVLYSGSCKAVQLPGIDGSFEILDNHAPLVSILDKGKIKLVDEKDQDTFFEVNGGVIEVLKNEVKILVE